MQFASVKQLLRQAAAEPVAITESVSDVSWAKEPSEVKGQSYSGKRKGKIVLKTKPPFFKESLVKSADTALLHNTTPQLCWRTFSQQISRGLKLLSRRKMKEKEPSQLSGQGLFNIWEHPVSEFLKQTGFPLFSWIFFFPWLFQSFLSIHFSFCNFFHFPHYSLGVCWLHLISMLRRTKFIQPKLYPTSFYKQGTLSSFGKKISVFGMLKTCQNYENTSATSFSWLFQKNKPIFSLTFADKNIFPRLFQNLAKMFIFPDWKRSSQISRFSRPGRNPQHRTFKASLVSPTLGNDDQFQLPFLSYPRLQSFSTHCVTLKVAKGNESEMRTASWQTNLLQTHQCCHTGWSHHCLEHQRCPFWTQRKPSCCRWCKCVWLYPSPQWQPQPVWN